MFKKKKKKRFYYRFYYLNLDFYLYPGILGAAPALPLLANPSLSAALLQVLLQNQAKAQQVLTPFWPPDMFPPAAPSSCF